MYSGRLIVSWEIEKLNILPTQQFSFLPPDYKVTLPQHLHLGKSDHMFSASKHPKVAYAYFEMPCFLDWHTFWLHLQYVVFRGDRKTLDTWSVCWIEACFLNTATQLWLLGGYNLIHHEASWQRWVLHLMCYMQGWLWFQPQL